jgi:hypothetical protein
MLPLRRPLLSVRQQRAPIGEHCRLLLNSRQSGITTIRQTLS